MDSRNDKKDGNFRWTDNDVIVLCEICIEYIRKNGRGQTFKWHEIHTELELKTSRKFQFKSLKNKFDAMRADWYMWKFLKTGETGLGWDPASGKISASDDWWKKKIAAKPEAKKFRNKPLHPTMEELYFQIFEGKRATEEGVVAPSIDPSMINVVNVEEGEVNEENGEDDICSGYSRLDDIEGQENTFFSDFIKDVGSDTLTQSLSQLPDNVFIVGSTQQSNNKSSKQSESPLKKTIKPTQMKRRRNRQSGGSLMLNGHMGTMVNVCNRALQILETDVNPPSVGNIPGGSNNAQNGANNSSSIGTAMEIVNRMVSEGYLVKASDLWCFLIHLLEDGVRRELFISIDDDDGRMAWINFMQRRE